ACEPKAVRRSAGIAGERARPHGLPCARRGRGLIGDRGSSARSHARRCSSAVDDVTCQQTRWDRWTARTKSRVKFGKSVAEGESQGRDLPHLGPRRRGTARQGGGGPCSVGAEVIRIIGEW